MNFRKCYEFSEFKENTLAKKTNGVKKSKLRDIPKLDDANLISLGSGFSESIPSLLSIAIPTVEWHNFIVRSSFYKE